MVLSEVRSRLFTSLHGRSNSESQPPSFSEHEVDRSAPRMLRLPRTDFQLASVNEQTAELLKTTNHVLVQISETKRLRQLKDASLAPSERVWIDSTIEDTVSAARDVTTLLEPARVEKATGNGKLSIGRQLRWVYRDNQRAQEKKNRLLLCHNSLMTVLSHLQRLNQLEPNALPVHELGGGLPAKTEPRDVLVRQRSDSEFTGVSDDTKRTINTSSLDTELNDLLAWRRSKGAPVLVSSEKLEIKTLE